MKFRHAASIITIVFTLILSSTVWADDYSDGVQLFWVNCYICHWSNNPEKAPRPPEGSAQNDTVQAMRVGEKYLRVQNVYGPDLRGIYNAPAGRRAKEGYRHSEAFTKAAPGLIWTPEMLDLWITDAYMIIPGSWMQIKIPDKEVRRKIILFLKYYKE